MLSGSIDFALGFGPGRVLLTIGGIIIIVVVGGSFIAIAAVAAATCSDEAG